MSIKNQNRLPIPEDNPDQGMGGAVDNMSYEDYDSDTYMQDVSQGLDEDFEKAFGHTRQSVMAQTESQRGLERARQELAGNVHGFEDVPAAQRVVATHMLPKTNKFDIVAKGGNHKKGRGPSEVDDVLGADDALEVNRLLNTPDTPETPTPEASAEPERPAEPATPEREIEPAPEDPHRIQITRPSPGVMPAQPAAGVRPIRPRPTRAESTGAAEEPTPKPPEMSEASAEPETLAEPEAATRTPEFARYTITQIRTVEDAANLSPNTIGVTADGFNKAGNVGSAAATKRRDPMGHPEKPNQDAFLHDPELGIGAVADGVGSRANSEQSARSVVDDFNDKWASTNPETLSPEAARQEMKDFAEVTRRDLEGNPTTTFVGFKTHSHEGRNYVTGLTVGDSQWMLLNLDTRKIEYVSPEQSGYYQDKEGNIHPRGDEASQAIPYDHLVDPAVINNNFGNTDNKRVEDSIETRELPVSYALVAYSDGLSGDQYDERVDASAINERVNRLLERASSSADIAASLVAMGVKNDDRTVVVHLGSLELAKRPATPERSRGDTESDPDAITTMPIPVTSAAPVPTSVRHLPPAESPYAAFYNAFNAPSPESEPEEPAPAPPDYSTLPPPGPIPAAPIPTFSGEGTLPPPTRRRQRPSWAEEGDESATAETTPDEAGAPVAEPDEFDRAFGNRGRHRRPGRIAQFASRVRQIGSDLSVRESLPSISRPSLSSSVRMPKFLRKAHTYMTGADLDPSDPAGAVAELNGRRKKLLLAAAATTLAGVSVLGIQQLANEESSSNPSASASESPSPSASPSPSKTLTPAPAETGKPDTSKPPEADRLGPDKGGETDRPSKPSAEANRTYNEDGYGITKNEDGSYTIKLSHSGTTLWGATQKALVKEGVQASDALVYNLAGQGLEMSGKSWEEAGSIHQGSTVTVKVGDNGPQITDMNLR